MDWQLLSILFYEENIFMVKKVFVFVKVVYIS